MASREPGANVAPPAPFWNPTPWPHRATADIGMVREAIEQRAAPFASWVAAAASFEILLHFPFSVMVTDLVIAGMKMVAKFFVPLATCRAAERTRITL
jgi:hypothetical protein